MKPCVIAFWVIAMACTLAAQSAKLNESKAAPSALEDSRGAATQDLESFRKPGVLIQTDLATGFYDGFDVSGNKLDTTKWTTECAAASYFQGTQLRDWLKDPTDSTFGPFVVSDGFAQLALDTYNKTGFSFYGTNGKTLKTFQPTPTTDYLLSIRMRLGSVRGGIVYGAYFYGCDPCPCTIHDELDIEVVTNYLQPGASPLRVSLNHYAAEPQGVGHPMIANLPEGFDPLALHEWRIRWGLNSVTYFVDDIDLFSTTTFVPQGLMAADMIAWAPDSSWPDAFDASLQPVMAASGNQHFVAQVDYVSVVPIPSSSATPSSTFMTVASSSLTSISGQAVTFTATILPSGTMGTVTFLDGSNTLGASMLSNGTATYATPLLTPGTHSITATYDGDSSHSSSTSPAISQTVYTARRRAVQEP
jgi:hypothetical protein